jgi:hypothetical protein
MKRLITCLFLILNLGGCTWLNQPEHLSLNHLTAIEGDASTTLLIAGSKETPFNICSQPAPDAVRSENVSEDMSFSFISIGSQAQDAKAADSSDEEEMVGRTPAVLLSREMFYRLCEFFHNVDLSTDQKIDLYKATLDAATKISIEEGKNTSIRIGETLETVINNSYRTITGRPGRPARRTSDTAPFDSTQGNPNALPSDGTANQQGGPAGVSIYTSPTTQGQCGNGVDDDEDGLIDKDDPNCSIFGIYAAENTES